MNFMLFWFLVWIGNIHNLMHCPLEIFATYEEHVFIELFRLFILINIAPVPRATGQRIGKQPGFVCFFLLIGSFHYLWYGFLAFRKIFTFSLSFVSLSFSGTTSLHSCDCFDTSLSISYRCFKQLGRIFCTTEGQRGAAFTPLSCRRDPKAGSESHDQMYTFSIAPFFWDRGFNKALALPPSSCYTPTYGWQGRSHCGHSKNSPTTQPREHSPIHQLTLKYWTYSQKTHF